MPDESPLEFGECTFCNRERTAASLLHEGRDFYVIADHAPVADAHVLLIPRHHYPHLAAVPGELDEEFVALKSLIGDFVREYYGPVTYWENGVFGQSVPHAHLHLLSVRMDTTLLAGHGAPARSLADLRSHHAATGSNYFLVEHEEVARVMPPDADLYRSIIADAKARNGGTWQHTAADRRVHGRQRVQSLMQRWLEYRHTPEPGARGSSGGSTAPTHRTTSI